MGWWWSNCCSRGPNTPTDGIVHIGGTEEHEFYLEQPTEQLTKIYSSSAVGSTGLRGTDQHLETTAPSTEFNSQHVTMKIPRRHDYSQSISKKV